MAPMQQPINLHAVGLLGHPYRCANVAKDVVILWTFCIQLSREVHDALLTNQLTDQSTNNPTS